MGEYTRKAGILKHKPSGISVIGSIAILLASIYGMYFGLKRYRDRHTESAKAVVYSVQCITDKNVCNLEIRFTVNDKLQKVMVQTSNPSTFRTNQEITVYYDPNNISDIIIEGGSKQMALAIFIVSLLLFLNIGWFLYNQYQIYTIFKEIF